MFVFMFTKTWGVSFKNAKAPRATKRIIMSVQYYILVSERHLERSDIARAVRVFATCQLADGVCLFIYISIFLFLVEQIEFIGLV